MHSRNSLRRPLFFPTASLNFGLLLTANCLLLVLKHAVTRPPIPLEPLPTLNGLLPQKERVEIVRNVSAVRRQQQCVS